MEDFDEKPIWKYYPWYVIVLYLLTALLIAGAQIAFTVWIVKLIWL